MLNLGSFAIFYRFSGLRVRTLDPQALSGRSFAKGTKNKFGSNKYFVFVFSGLDFKIHRFHLGTIGMCVCFFCDSGEGL